MGNNCLKSRTMSASLVNATSKHTATVIFLHGLGDTGHGWSSMLQSIRQPHIKYICPTANTMPVTLNGGMKMPSWFDIHGLSPGCSEDEPGIQAAADLLQNIIAEEESVGIDRSRIIVGGFSQGGAVAYYSAFAKQQPPLAGIIGLSTWLPLYETFPTAVKGNQSTPVMQCHGQDDCLISYKFGQMTSELIRAFNSNIQFKTYPGLSHSSCDQEMEDVKEFINKCLPPV